MAAVFVLAMLLATGCVFAAPLLALVVVLAAVAAMVLIGATLRQVGEGIGEFFEHPLVKFILAAILIWIAIAWLKLPVWFVILAAIACVALVFLMPFFQAIEDSLNEIFEHPLMKALVVIGILIAIAIAWAHSGVQRS